MSLNRTLEEEQSQLQAPGEVYADMMYVEGQNANELITPSVSAEPIDRFNFVYWIMFLQGAGALFPWNAFISAPDYFNKVYNNDNILFYFSLAYSYPNLLGLIVMIAFGNRIPLNLRIYSSYLMCIVLVMVIPIMGFLGIEEKPEIGLTITLAAIVIIASGTSILQGSIFGFAGILPSRYMVSTMAGNGFAGLLVSIIRVVTKLIGERGGNQPSMMEVTIGTSVYFFVSCITLIACVITFFFMMRTPFVLFFLRKSQPDPTSKLQKPESMRVMGAISDAISDSASSDTSSRTITGTFYLCCQSIFNQIKLIWVVTKKIWTYEIYIFFTFVITIAIFPGMIGFIKSAYGPAMQNWLPIILICVFNFFDLVGRAAPSWYAMEKHFLWLLTFGRTIFIVAFLLCIKPRLITNDFFPITFMALLSLTNGYLTSLTMMYGPQECEAKEKVVAGTMMTFLLVFGVLVGANVGSLLTLYFNP